MTCFRKEAENKEIGNHQEGKSKMSISITIEANSLLNKVLSSNASRIFSGICDHLIAIGSASQPKTMLVCCPSRGEGATTFALGLAFAAAEKRLGQVLLIDGNCHNPSISNFLGLSQAKGLADLLFGPVESNVAIKTTNKPNFSVMGTGAIGKEYIQITQPPKLQGLLNKLLEWYSFILLDGPSINAYPESILYASQVDRIFFVVHGGVTRAPVAEEALSKLSAAQCDKEKIDIVLNRRVFVIPQSIYKKL